MVRVSQKLACISEVYMLNLGQITLGLRRVNQKPQHRKQFHFTEHRGVKNTNIARRGFEITATPQVEILFTTSPH